MSNERIFNAAMKFQLKYLMSFVDLAARMPFSTIIFAQIHTNRQTHTRAHTHTKGEVQSHGHAIIAKPHLQYVYSVHCALCV